MKIWFWAAPLAAMALQTPAMAQTREQREKIQLTREEKAAARAEKKKLGSLHIRCDGEPNNMTGGESFARLLGAVTLLGIFAPSPEAPDPSKRKFGEEGVEICTQLIDEGEKMEKNAVRRVPLILARAIHHIEAKNYEAALVDVEKARGEAATAGLSGNAYFDRSMGLTFNILEAEAKLRMNDSAGAQEASMRSSTGMQYSFVPSVFSRDYSEFLKELTPAAEAKLASQSRLRPTTLYRYADRLDEVGRFSESAEKVEALITVTESISSENEGSFIYSRAAVSHALAGQWDKAELNSQFARENMNRRKADGLPEDNASEIVEMLDFYGLLALANQGDMTAARRTFAARSQWTAPSFGAVMAANTLLREGAEEDELFGSLVPTADDMWRTRYQEQMAIKLQKDTDNDTLFDMIVPYAKVKEFESRSKNTWRVEKKSKMMAKEPDEDGFWRIFATGSPFSSIDSVVLHAALQAKSRGKEGFTISVIIPRNRSYYSPSAVGYTKFVDRSETSDALFVPADEVIAELSEIIPSPEQLKIRKRERDRRK